MLTEEDGADRKELNDTMFDRYVDNLNEEACRWALVRLLKHPENHEFIVKSAKEFDKFFQVL